MTDPFSIIAGVVGVTAGAVKASQCLFQLVDDVRNAPQEVSAISRDAHAFHSIVYSLQMALEADDVRHVLGTDILMTQMIKNLNRPLENCRTILDQLLTRIQNHLKSAKDAPDFRMSVIDLKWSLYTKNEVLGLMSRLEATKATLGSAPNSICT